MIRVYHRTKSGGVSMPLLLALPFYLLWFAVLLVCWFVIGTIKLVALVVAGLTLLLSRPR